MLKKSPSSHIAMKTTDSPSAELRFQFSSICGEKTTTMRIRYLVVQARGKREQSPGRLESGQKRHDQLHLPIQHAIETEPHIWLIASISRRRPWDGGNMSPYDVATGRDSSNEIFSTLSIPSSSGGRDGRAQTCNLNRT